MANVFDYLYWRDDLTLEQDPLGEVDVVVLTRISYLPLEQLPEAKQPRTVRDAAVALLMEPDVEHLVRMEGDLYLLTVLARSRRFGDMKLFALRHLLDEASQTQFSAVTIELQPDRYFLSYRGTDNTLIGWKEDFNMVFTCPVTAQTLAVSYLEEIASQTRGELLLGGHSKGGNLAVYAGACCPEAVQQRIGHVYNLDGPGFNEPVLSSPGYQAICQRISTFVPQSSVVGMLLEHEETYTIVHSSQAVNLLQHDTYTWEVDRNRFTYVETVTQGSRLIDAAIKGWVAALEPAQREKFIDAIYALLSRTNAQTLGQLRENWLETGMTVLKGIREMDEETRALVIQTVRALTNAVREELHEVVHARPVLQIPRRTTPEEKE